MKLISPKRRVIRRFSYFLAGLLAVIVAARYAGFITPLEMRTIIIAKLIATGNLFTGVYLYEKGLHKDNSTFMLIVMGGLLGRMFAVLLAILFCLHFLKLSQNYLILFIFLFYFSFLVPEFRYLQKLDNKANFTQK